MSRVPQYDLLPDWDKYLLGDICKLRSDNYEPKKNGTLKYIGLEHIESGIPIITNFGFETDVKSTKHRFYPNDILYGKLRPYLDKVALSNIEGISSSDILILKTEQKKVLPKYLTKLLHHNRFLRYATLTMTGTTLPRTNWKTLRKFMIFLPKIVEQKKIVAILENVDKLIQTTQRLIEKLQECNKGLMQRLFTEGIGHTEFKETKLGRIPKEWKLTRIRNHIKSLISGNWGEDPIKGQYSYPVLRSTEISHLGKLRNIENAERRFLSSEQIEKYHLRKNDILIVSSSGSPHLIGRACFFDISDSEMYCFSNFLLRLRTKAIEPKYLYNFMKSSQYERVLLRLQQTATGLRNLRKDDLKSILLPLPSDEEQKLIIKKFDVINKKINLERDFLIQIREMKKGLMQVLLTGKKRV
jgi:type I restriction enzyme S subunit